jgi:hypothetical protein
MPAKLQVVVALSLIVPQVSWACGGESRMILERSRTKPNEFVFKITSSSNSQARCYYLVSEAGSLLNLLYQARLLSAKMEPKHDPVLAKAEDQNLRRLYNPKPKGEAGNCGSGTDAETTSIKTTDLGPLKEALTEVANFLPKTPTSSREPKKTQRDRTSAQEILKEIEKNARKNVYLLTRDWCRINELLEKHREVVMNQMKYKSTGADCRIEREAAEATESGANAIFDGKSYYSELADMFFYERNRWNTPSKVTLRGGGDCNVTFGPAPVSGAQGTHSNSQVGAQ